jgi:hypothetical protein
MEFVSPWHAHGILTIHVGTGIIKLCPPLSSETGTLTSLRFRFCFPPDRTHVASASMSSARPCST